MTFANPVPWWVLAVLLAAAAGLAWRSTRPGTDAVTAWQRLALSILRLTAVALVVVLIMRPVRADPAAAAGARVAVVVDRSMSMGIADVQGRTRIAAAAELVARLLPTVPARVRAEPYGLGHRLERLGDGALQADADRTDLSAALTALRGQTPPFVGVLLVSDGALDAPATLGRSVPISVLPVGGTLRGPDRGIVALSVGEPIATDASVDLVATLVQDAAPNEPFDVRVAADGSPVETRRVATPGPGVPVHVSFRIAPASDRPTTFTVELPPMPGEVTTINNRASVLVPPPGGPRRVLVIEGSPGHEHSFLKRAWLSDRGLMVDAVVRKGATDAGAPAYYLQTAGGEGSDLKQGFPATLAALCRYDVVVLANAGAGTFSPQQLDRLAYFVAERGGGLVVLGRGAFDPRASRGTPLDDLLPLDATAQWTLTDVPPAAGSGVTLLPAGLAHPLMRLGGNVTETPSRWAALPALAEVFAYGGPRPGARVLAVAPAPGGVQLPLVATQTFGRGRVLAFAGEASWRWKMQMPSTDRTFEIFWRQAVRWASARHGPVAVTADQDDRGRLVVRVTVRDEDFIPVPDAQVLVTLAGPDGVLRDERLVVTDPAAGLYEVRREVEAAGPLRLSASATRGPQRLGSAETWWAPSLKSDAASPWRDDGVLRRVADETGGRVLEPGNAARWIESLTVQPASAARVAPRDLWHRWWVLSGLVGLLSAEWALRRRWGLR